MNYPLATWRLVLTPPAHGSWNMSVDEAILEEVAQGSAPATLRFYAWEPPCLSIGYAQPSSDIDFSRLVALGWDWVRRPTGGRAILHTDELTYSVIARQSDPRVSGSVLESYQHLSRALLAGLRILGLQADVKPGAVKLRSQASTSACFEVPSDYEIVAGGKKLIGSAQARRKNVVLQHGTLPLAGDLTRIVNVLAYPDEASRMEASSRLLSHATTIEMLAGLNISWDEAAKAFTSGFQQELAISLVESELTAKELSRAAQLDQEKYSNPSWAERI